MNSIRPEAIRAGMRFLSDDALEGRGTGSRGYDIAAKFMASQFESLGLQPAGDNDSYFQDVPLRSAKPDETKTTFILTRSGKEQTLIFRKDYISRGNPVLPETSVQAPVVFVGDGVTAPDQNYDDYKGIDAKGKIVAFMFEAPNFESSLKAHYSSGEVKLQNAVAHGAVGVIVLDDPVLERLYSFNEQVRDLSFPDLRWLDKQQRPNDYFPELKGNAFLSLEATKKFFEGSGHSAEDVFAAVKAGKPMSFEMPISAQIHNVTALKEVAGRNVVAKLEGSDPALKNEYVVYSSHLDHLGVGEPVKGDSIYNGALDNASGSAILLEVARAFSGMKTRPRRSILFLSVTGEEAGLLGSDYFAHYPTVKKSSVVANVNMDEDLMLWPLRDIVAFGAEHSSLDAVVRKAAERMHLSESPDPNPEEVVFIRSDQYSFVKQGVPAIFPVPGFKSDDPKIKPEEIFKNWEQTRYHQPQDDMDQPGLDWDAAAKYARFVFLCGFLITEDPQRPTWNKGDFFGEHYGHQAN
jgi:Peptidase family M28/PA domain